MATSDVSGLAARLRAKRNPGSGSDGGGDGVLFSYAPAAMGGGWPPGAVEVGASWCPMEVPAAVDERAVPEAPWIEWGTGPRLRDALGEQAAILSTGRNPLGRPLTRLRGLTNEERNTLCRLLLLLDWWDPSGAVQEVLATEAGYFAATSGDYLEAVTDDYAGSLFGPFVGWLREAARLLRFAIAYRIGADLYGRSADDTLRRAGRLRFTAWLENGVLRVAIRDPDGQWRPLVDVPGSQTVLEKQIEDLLTVEEESAHKGGPRAPVFVCEPTLNTWGVTFKTHPNPKISAVLLFTGVS